MLGCLRNEGRCHPRFWLNELMFSAGDDPVEHELGNLIEANEIRESFWGSIGPVIDLRGCTAGVACCRFS
jgi:hypothetical protein